MQAQYPICLNCKNFNEDDEDALTCTAFPDGIPEAIHLNRHDHRQPFEGDNSILFDPKNKAATTYADELFGTKE